MSAGVGRPNVRVCPNLIPAYGPLSAGRHTQLRPGSPRREERVELSDTYMTKGELA